MADAEPMAKSDDCTDPFQTTCLPGGPGKLLGLRDFRGLEGSKITIFLSILTGFEAHGKIFCDILVQLNDFEDKFGKFLHLKGMLRPKILWRQHLQGLSHIFNIPVRDSGLGPKRSGIGAEIRVFDAIRELPGVHMPESHAAQPLSVPISLDRYKTGHVIF
jgi:hypothetical protein